MTDLSTLFSAADAGKLRVIPTVVLEWYDGPLEGFADVMKDDQCWHFKIVADRFRPDDLDDRVFAFTRLSAEVTSMVRSVNKEAVFERAFVERALAEIGPPMLFVRAASFEKIEAVWRCV